MDGLTTRIQDTLDRLGVPALPLETARRILREEASVSSAELERLESVGGPDILLVDPLPGRAPATGAPEPTWAGAVAEPDPVREAHRLRKRRGALPDGDPALGPGILDPWLVVRPVPFDPADPDRHRHPMRRLARTLSDLAWRIDRRSRLESLYWIRLAREAHSDRAAFGEMTPVTLSDGIGRTTTPRPSSRPPARIPAPTPPPRWRRVRG